ncbi:NAD-dependent epimerase/dehydratase family protein [Christiangramia sp. SM2212]|uniref:NAD-dependent epimerase/dehydratase family protein n=1 Tax=Christiangramia sediminicola TaxID=3073267 RepID=A0ABU1ETG5_9FLAO|nr:NAD-dependent epimerase/dehydratase family protein [Christiangramia sp. SM2212]MDR5591272.1 NAD-dependent epimerase/dehydratase family protein [Christiangramia sp. SM2212]
MEQKTAIILGATGLTGSILLDKLVDDPRYRKIKVFSRNHVHRKSEKIEEYLINLFELEKFTELFKADEVFCCIGTTQKKTPDNDTYRMVDFGIPATAAKLCHRNEIETFQVISAMGADEKSRFFYNRVKGEMEGAVLEQQIPNTYILQPSLIGGEREESRPFEFIWKKIMLVGDHLLVGSLRKYRSIHPEIIVKAMIYLANNKHRKGRITSEEIREIADRK